MYGATEHYTAQGKNKNSIFILLFLLSLIIPVHIEIGGLLLNPYRILIILAIVPVLLMGLSGQMGRFAVPDVLFILYAIWTVVAVVFTNGMDRIEYAGISFIEALMPYFIARILIRNQENFLYAVKCLVYIVIIILLPAAIFESFLDIQIINKFFGQVLPVYNQVNMEMRLGLHRAQGPFEHPIMMGIFCLPSVVLAFLVLNSLWKAGLTGIALFLCLSMGPIVGGICQGCLIVWDRLTNGIAHRWQILIGGLTFSYITIDALSNRSPVEIFISLMTFNVGTAFNRVHIWTYGTKSVEKYPIFGLGLDRQWERPEWMLGSVDNFWLVLAMRHGLPVFIFFAAGIVLACLKASRAHRHDDRVLNCQKAYIFMVISMSVSLATVHVWAAPYAMFMFAIGMGGWLFAAAPGAVKELGKGEEVEEASDSKPKVMIG